MPVLEPSNSAGGGIGLTGNWVDNCILRADGDQDNASLQGSSIYTDDSGNLGITETMPESTLEITNLAPYLTLHNNTHEDGNIGETSGRESKIIFKGEQSGGEESTLCIVQAGHNETSDDQKGVLLFRLNDGNDGDTPTERMRINSSGFVGINRTIPAYPLEVHGVSAGSTVEYVGYFSRTLGSGSTRLFINNSNSKKNTGFGMGIDGVQVWSFGCANLSGSGSNYDCTIYNDITSTATILLDGTTDNIGFSETYPETALEITKAAPYITLHCNTESDADESGMSIIWFSREQSGGEETHCAAIKGFHDGLNDDQKGAIALFTNSGTDDDAPTERMRIDSAGAVDVVGDLTAGTIQADNGFTGSFVNGDGDTVTVVGGIITDVS